MDDVTFGRNGRDAETWRLHRAATAMIAGRSLMSMNARCNWDNAERGQWTGWMVELTIQHTENMMSSSHWSGLSFWCFTCLLT